MKKEELPPHIKKELGEMQKSGRRMFSKSIPFVCLALVNQKPRHGYEIMQEGEELFKKHARDFFMHGEAVLLTPSKTYPALHRLEKEKLVKSHWEERKKYYSITPKGVKELKIWKELFKKSIKIKIGIYKELFNEEVI